MKYIFLTILLSFSNTNLFSQDTIPPRKYWNPVQQWARMDTVLHKDYNFNMPTSVQNVVTGNLATSTSRGEHSYDANPAGLGKYHKDFQSTSATMFYSPIHIHSFLDGLNHTYFAASQFLNNKLGCVALSINTIDFWIKYFRDDSLKIFHTLNSSITREYSASWGKMIKENHSIGISLKYINGPEIFSKLNENKHAFLMDVGYMSKYFNWLNFGFAMKNIGVPLKGLKPYIETRTDRGVEGFILNYEKNEKYYMTPIILNFGLGYEYNCHSNNYDPLYISLGIFSSKPFNAGYWDNLKNLIVGFGNEYIVFNTIVTEYGIKVDNKSKLVDLQVGAGLKLFNHLKLGAVVISPAENNRRNIHKSASLTLYRLLNWKKSDWKWWRK